MYDTTIATKLLSQLNSFLGRISPLSIFHLSQNENRHFTLYL